MNDFNPEKPQDPADPKIIVDENWKDQVQAEKETLEGTETPSEAEPDAGEFPDASFPMLVTTLATQATVALGQQVTPDAQEPSVDLGLAKHLIDTLGVLAEKTQGNLLPEESDMMTNILHQLRMFYVAVKDQLQENPPKKSSIELP